MDAANFLLQSAAVASFSLTVTKSKLFKPIQRWELFKCPYCFSHWIAWIVGAFTDNPHITRSRWVDFAVYWFALIAASCLISGAMQRLSLWQEAKIEQLEADLYEATELVKSLTGGER